MVYDVILEAFKALFLLGVPVVIAATVAGTLVGAIQGVTGIHDAAIGYTVKLIAVAGTIYILWPGVTRAVTDLMALALR